MQPQTPLTAAPGELLGVIAEMFPQQYSHALSELTARKLGDEVRRLTAELSARDTENHGHSHPHGDG
ncbi:hypothetical protein ACH4LS_28975 [Streptomyces luteogriseus]|uniref:hypothetical protein n=1 Tax=Streptomyces luteogriseus TaxID=68233 RepID=UPI0037B3AC45